MGPEPGSDPTGVPLTHAARPTPARSAGPDRLPAAFAPFAEVRALPAEGGVVAVARVDPRLVRKGAEHPLLEVVHQRREVVGRPGLAWATGKQRVAREDVGAVV